MPRFSQPSLFSKGTRTTVSFPTFFRKTPRKDVIVRGGARKATRKFSGDSWYRKLGFK